MQGISPSNSNKIRDLAKSHSYSGWTGLLSLATQGHATLTEGVNGCGNEKDDK
jgi:hypothetical protein